MHSSLIGFTGMLAILVYDSVFYFSQLPYSSMKYTAVPVGNKMEQTFLNGSLQMDLYTHLNFLSLTIAFVENGSCPLAGKFSLIYFPHKWKELVEIALFL